MKSEEIINSKLEIIKEVKFEGYTLIKYTLNIIELVFHKGFEAELTDAHNLIKAMSDLRENEQAMLLLVIYAPDNVFSKEVRDYVASKDRNSVVKAEALIMDSLGLKIVGNFYMKINKPARPAQIFNIRENGIDWLLSLKI